MFTWPTIVKKPKGKNILVLAPHMDDEIIGCGGVICKHIQSGDRVTVVYFTRGDRGNKNFSSDNILSNIRKLEIQRSNEILGIQKSFFLDFEDGTNDEWGSKKDELREIYLELNPDLVYLPPYYDLHLDHRKTNWLFKEATEFFNVCDLCIYEVWTPINPNIIINITQQMDTKISAISACKTQVDSVDYISFIKNLNSYRSSFAMSPLVKYAECFYLLSANEYFLKFNKNEFDWHSAEKNKRGGNEMAKITYEFYSEKDAAAVAELMRNNKFWIGKFDKNLTGEKFVDYQRKKGTIFGIVGKKNDKVVSYVAAYKTGGQKVANKNQAFICALIIDQKYRMSVFSITDMFSLLIKELINLGYNDLICEVAKDNYPSFYMMRKCGFVIIDEQPTLYGDYVLHNYLPGVIKLADRIDYADSDALPEIMQKLDKKNLYRAEEIIDNRFINIDCKAKKEKYSLYIDTLSGNIAGIHMRDANFKIWPCDRDFTAYTFDNFDTVPKAVTVEFLCKDIVTKTQKFETEHFEIQLADDIDKISFHVEGDVDKYTFFVEEMREQGHYKFEQAIIKLNDFIFEEKSAFLTCAKDEKQFALFKEMWPHICAPYIEGIFIPNYKKNISIEPISDNRLVVTEKTEDYVLTREYKSFGKRVEISTKAKMISKKQVQPMFQFALYDLSYNMDILLDDKSVANRKYDPEDGHCVTEEMIFLNFLQHEYSNKYFKQIDISFDSMPKTVYRIKTNKLAKCFCQLNYLGIEYNRKIYKGKNEIDFGTITIERIL